MHKYQRIETFLLRFLHEEVAKAGFSKVVLGISGGVDSAVVAVLAQKVFGNNFLGLMLPFSSSSKESVSDAITLCEKFKIRLEKSSIAPLVDAYFKDNAATNLRIGNFCARMRMAVLYDISARENALVLGTSNKSELLLGYGTIFGDLACALNPLGELYKTEVFEFAQYLGVPESIIAKAPSADLWEGQSDEADFGFTYAKIDDLLYAHIEEKKDESTLIKKGFDKKLVYMVLDKIKKNAFKGKLPMIAPITALK